MNQNSGTSEGVFNVTGTGMVRCKQLKFANQKYYDAAQFNRGPSKHPQQADGTKIRKARNNKKTNRPRCVQTSLFPGGNKNPIKVTFDADLWKNVPNRREGG